MSNENRRALLAIATRMRKWVEQGVNEFELKALSQQITDICREESRTCRKVSIYDVSDPNSRDSASLPRPVSGRRSSLKENR